MAKYMCMDTLKWLLREVHQADELLAYDRFADYDMDSFMMLLDSTKTWADQEFYPYFKEMDEKPVVFENGKVKSHPQLKNIFKQAGENGWLGSYFDYDHGGAQLPHTIANANNHIVEAANNHIPGYLGLTTGAAQLIVTFGSQELIDRYVPNMLNGKWGGTMCLTEPQAGSSLSDITTSAKPNEDGTYHIKGQKIFISGGDHEATENIIHLVLARIEGAPAGTKGISLFVVPRYDVNSDGTYVDNHVQTAGDFQKMGQRGYSTVHLVFGEDAPCKGYLVGEAHLGLKYMFLMMNGARIDVGMTAASTATAAYYASLQYAKERPQGRKIQNSGKKDINQGQTLIINHADVRRMLLLQKAIVEGSLSLLIETSKYSDLVHVTEGEEKKNHHLLLELLTPIAKTYPSEKGQESISNGLQVLGGYGYCMDFILQQYHRDIRIMSLYEGTTGIQSIDLLGRKVTMENGKALMLLTEKVKTLSQDALTFDELRPYVQQLSEAGASIKSTLQALLPHAEQGNYETYLSDATIFMKMMSTFIIGYQWLKMAVIAKKNLVTGQMKYQPEFYESKIHTMKFFFKYELPHMEAFKKIILNEEELTVVDKSEKVL